MRKKLSLRPDALRVESFATGEAEGARGTVEGNEATAVGCTQPRQCPATQCTCGVNGTFAERDAATYCECCV